MMSRISRKSVLAFVVALMALSFTCKAQGPAGVAELKRMEYMYPDSLALKQQIALLSLNYSISNPKAEGVEAVMGDAEKYIQILDENPAADKSDVLTLKGFYYLVRIVQDPAVNGRKYYMEVSQNFDKALKLNPENKLAQVLQQKFYEGMNASRP